MEKASRIKEQLEIDKLVCIYDQGIYTKAMEIQLKEPEKFSSFNKLYSITIFLLQFMVKEFHELQTKILIAY